jgi:Lar family restriction alleviation protein
MTELNIFPCPVCGGGGELSTGQIGPMRAIAYYIECMSCSSSSNMKFGIENAIEAWNKRV